jgi:hypothetical protein
MAESIRAKQRIINFPNRKKVDAAPPPVVEAAPEREIPKRPMYIPKKYAVEWAEMCIELMGRKRWSHSMIPLVEAAMVARVVFDQATDLMEKLEAQKAVFKYYRLLELTPKRDPGYAGRPPKGGNAPATGGLEEDNTEAAPVESRWGN